MKRGLIIAALPLLLGGCLPILPPAIQLAATGLSGVAFLATGKSTTDHLISAAIDEDCSLIRVAFGDQPCQDYTSDGHKPLTEIVAYYPGDADDWIDRASIPTGEVSGRTMLAMSTVGDPDVRVRDGWPGTRGSDTLLVEAAVENQNVTEAPNAIDAGLPSVKDLPVSGFLPVETSFELQPIKLKSVPAPSGHLVLPVSTDVSWTVEPQAPARSSLPAAASEPAPVEMTVETTEQKSPMTVLPVLRPIRLAPGEQTFAIVNPTETFAESGLAGAIERPREQGVVTLLQDSFASSQGAAGQGTAGQGAAGTPPVIMSVRLKGSLLHRVTGGAFSRYDAIAAHSSFEPVSRLTR